MSWQSQGQVPNDQLVNAEQWIQPSNNLHYILVSTWEHSMQTKHARQRFRGMAADTCKVLHTSWYKKHWLPYKAVKPQLDEQKFEESFTTWEFQFSKYEQDNTTRSLVIEYYKAASSLNRTSNHIKQQQPRTSTESSTLNNRLDKEILQRATRIQQRKKYSKKGKDK